MVSVETSSSDVPALREENNRLQRAVHELSLLNELAASIGASKNSTEVINTIVSRSLKAVDAQQGTITLVNRVPGGPLQTLVRAVTASSVAGKFHLNDAIAGWMELNRKPLLIDDVTNDARFRGADFDASVATVLAVPLIVKSDLIGVLAVYNKRNGQSFNADDQRLLSIIATQSAQIIENARLYEKEQALAKVREQLRLAAEVQKHLLPEQQPCIEGYEIVGTSVAAQEIGGDYFDFLPIHDGSLAICLGDVSGKGLPASLLMANVQAMVRMLTSMNCGVEECMRRANELLYRCTPTEKFVTFFHCVLDPRRHAIEFCNAGHNPPLLFREKETEKLQTKGVVLGVVERFDFGKSSLGMEAGDVLVIYSDGVTEAIDAGDEEFGEERLRQVVSAARAESAAAIQRAILTAVKMHAGEQPQHDDITLVVVKRTAAD